MKQSHGSEIYRTTPYALLFPSYRSACKSTTRGQALIGHAALPLSRLKIKPVAHLHVHWR